MAVRVIRALPNVLHFGQQGKHLHTYPVASRRTRRSDLEGEKESRRLTPSPDKHEAGHEKGQLSLTIEGSSRD